MAEQLKRPGSQGEGTTTRPKETREILEGESFSDIDHIQVQLQNPKVVPLPGGNKGTGGNAGTGGK